jgi:hypothetical protein
MIENHRNGRQRVFARVANQVFHSVEAVARAAPPPARERSGPGVALDRGKARQDRRGRKNAVADSCWCSDHETDFQIIPTRFLVPSVIF